MKDMFGMMKQAKAMQEKLESMQAEVANLSVEGISGAGLVKITLTAKGDLKEISIDPSLMKDSEVEVLEDLIVAAHNDARHKAEKLMQDKMQDLTGGLQLPPGFKLPF